MKHSYCLWMVVFLAFSLALPLYSVAADMKLTLITKDGDYVTTTDPVIKGFFMAGDQNLFLLTDGPLLFAAPNPAIDIGTLSANISPAADGSLLVTYSQGGTFHFTVSSQAVNVALSAPYLPGGGFVPGTGSGVYTSWLMQSQDLGNYMAVFQADVPGTPGKTSQRVVMFKIVPPGYSLTVNVVGSGSVTKNQDKAAYPLSPTESVQLTPTAGSGYMFSGWSGDLSGNANPATIQMDNNKTVTATFTQIPTYRVTVNNQNPTGGSITPDFRDVLSGDTATFTVTNYATYNASVSEGTLTGSTWTISNVTSTHTANINFSQTPTYTVTVNNQNPAGGSVSPPSQSVISGNPATFTVTPVTGFTASVSEGSLSGTTWTISNVASTHTANINFTQSGGGRDVVCGNGSSIESPICINKFGTVKTKSYIASNATYGGNNDGMISIPAGEKVYYMVDPYDLKQTHVVMLVINIAFKSGTSTICSSTQDKGTGAYSAEFCTQTSSYQKIYSNATIDNTRYYIGIDNTASGSVATDWMWANVSP